MSREGRGAAGRRYWRTEDFGGFGINLYKWNPPGPDGEGDEAQGKFFIGQSGTWYELVEKDLRHYPHSRHYAYEVTEESKRRQSADEEAHRRYDPVGDLLAGDWSRYDEENAPTQKVEP